MLYPILPNFWVRVRRQVGGRGEEEGGRKRPTTFRYPKNKNKICDKI